MIYRRALDWCHSGIWPPLCSKAIATSLVWVPPYSLLLQWQWAWQQAQLQLQPLYVSWAPGIIKDVTCEFPINIIHSIRISWPYFKNSNIGPRLLSQQINTIVDSITAESCTAACKSVGYGLAGLEYGQECCTFICSLSPMKAHWCLD